MSDNGRRCFQIRRLITGIVLAIALLPHDADAGARPYAYVQGTESLPETGLELESWFDESSSPGSPAGWTWWIGPVVGITDHLEAGLFALVTQAPITTGETSSSLDLDSLRYQVSYLLADRGVWPVDLRLRLEFGQPIADHPFRASTEWLYLIASRDWGRLNVTVNLVPWTAISTAKFNVLPFLDYWAGASFQVHSGIRIGAEFVGGTMFAPTGAVTTLDAGPSISAGVGRVWASASYGFGLTGSSPQNARIVVGLAF